LIAGIGLVALWLLLIAGPPEVARWYRAAAAEAALKDDIPRAFYRINQALAWQPYSPDLLDFRAGLYLEVQDLPRAEEDSRRAVEFSKGQMMDALVRRMDVHQRQGDHDRALQDADRIVQLALETPLRGRSQIRNVFQLRAEALNGRAYARAQAQRDLALGLVDIQKAFQLWGGEEVAAFLDTRGYLRFLLGDLNGALQDLEHAVKQHERELEIPRIPLRSLNLEARQLMRQQTETTAVILYHRGLVYQEFGRWQEAAEDLRRADELGYCPAKGVW
jgi:tetratricopeptide (TPR) repeat protein